MGAQTSSTSVRTVHSATVPIFSNLATILQPASGSQALSNMVVNVGPGNDFNIRPLPRRAPGPEGGLGVRQGPLVPSEEEVRRARARVRGASA